MPRPTKPHLHWIAWLALALPVSGVTGEPASDWFKRLQENRPWAALQGVRQVPGQAQIAAQIGAFVGDEAAACALFGRSVLPEGAGYRDALDTIESLAVERHVVMLNESHFRPAHRAFLLQVIERLHALGFDALAAETLYRAAPAQLRGGEVDVGIGFYTHDPLFAAALRRAQALGWEFVHYEAMDGNGREAREAGQARNLAEWLGRNPGRRLLVYAGGSHISKVADEGWMAARFIEDTGIEPLTIQQAATACADAGVAWPVTSARPQVAFRDDLPEKGSGDADLMVVHPPDAVATANSLLGKETSICFAPVSRDTLLRAFAAGESPNAIARDQGVAPAGARALGLWLAPGRHRIEREHLDGRQTLGYITVPEEPGETCLLPERG